MTSVTMLGKSFHAENCPANKVWLSRTSWPPPKKRQTKIHRHVMYTANDALQSWAKTPRWGGMTGLEPQIFQHSESKHQIPNHTKPQEVFPMTGRSRIKSSSKFLVSRKDFGRFELHTNGFAVQSSTGWWLNQPIWKIWSSNWIIFPGKGENNLKPPPSQRWFEVNFFTLKMIWDALRFRSISDVTTRRNRSMRSLSSSIFQSAVPVQDLTHLKCWTFGHSQQQESLPENNRAINIWYYRTRCRGFQYPRKHKNALIGNH